MLQLIPPPRRLSRSFKTAWFAKAARKRGISDDQLCIAMEQVRQGQAVNLGGGVWKKRLNDNSDRSIIVAKGGRNWFYVYLFAKKDRENIDKDEEVQFKKLADKYASLTSGELASMLECGRFVEICNVDSR